MAKRYLEIIDDPSGGFTLRAKVKHGPGDMHTVQLSPQDVHAIQIASKRQINRLAEASQTGAKKLISDLGCHSQTSGAFEGEEDERGVQGWGANRRGYDPLDVSGCGCGEIVDGDEVGWRLSRANRKPANKVEKMILSNKLNRSMIVTNPGSTWGPGIYFKAIKIANKHFGPRAAIILNAIVKEKNIATR